jgi:hypothetical protein
VQESRAALARELAILASHCACMRSGVRGLAAVLLEYPAHLASVPDTDSIPRSRSTKENGTTGVPFSFVGGAAAIE